MMSQISSTTPGGRFVRRCCLFYLFALIGFWTLSICGMYARARSRSESFSVNSIFFRGGDDVFRDFLNFDPVTERMRKEAGYLPICYPAPMMCGYVLFTRVFPRPLNAYLAFIVISAVSGAVCLKLALSPSRDNRLPLAGVVSVSLALSYPLMYLVERANMEGIVWAVLALGLTAFVARHHKTAGVLFALAASMKIYPGVLVLLLVARKRYKAAAISMVAGAVFTVIALRLLGPSIPGEVEEVRAGLAHLSATHIMAYLGMEIRYDHSLFAIVKQLLHVPYGKDAAALNNKIRAAALPYSLLMISGFVALYWFRIRKLPLLNQTIALIIVSVTVPYMSSEYTLSHVYFAWALFLLFLARDVAARPESITWPAAAMMLASFAFVFALEPLGHYAGQLKTCALMVLLLIAVTVPMRSSLLDDEKRPA